MLVGLLVACCTTRQTTVETDISTAGLREVAFTFDMSKAEHVPGQWDPGVGLTLDISKVQVSSTDWKVGDRWLVEGTYTLGSGDFHIHIIQDYNGTSRHNSSGQARLAPGSGEFRLAYELVELQGQVLSNDLIVHVYDNQSDDSLRCRIDIADTQ